MKEQLEEATDEPEMERLTGDIEADVMPSLTDQMDESGRGVTGMRMSMATVSHPETDEPIGELLVDMSGAIWFESEEGPRVRYDANALVNTAIDLIGESPYHDGESDEEE